MAGWSNSLGTTEQIKTVKNVFCITLFEGPTSIGISVQLV